MNKPQSTSPRARLQALLAIPERDRTDAEWDELNELEITLAAGNRANAPGYGERKGGPQQPAHAKPAAAPPHGRKPSRKHKKQAKKPR